MKSLRVTKDVREIQFDVVCGELKKMLPERKTHKISATNSSFHVKQRTTVNGLVKHQKVAKYFETDCVQGFLLLFIFLLAAKLVKNSHI